MLNLTRRQEDFILELIDLSDEFDAPLHYSLPAERLGVSPFTTYDTHCTLEKKGVVTSDYQLAADITGPGRVERLFCPSESALQRRDETAGKIRAQSLDMDVHKQVAMDLMRHGESSEDPFPTEHPAGIPPDENPELSYCVEVFYITALRLKPGPGVESPSDFGPQILSSCTSARDRLLLLGRTAFGILLLDRSCACAWTMELLEHIKRHMQIANCLSRNECNQLIEAFIEFFNPRQPNPGSADAS